MTPHWYKYPEGYYTGARVIANSHYFRVNPRVQLKVKERKGTVVSPSGKRNEVWVLWDDAKARRPIDIRFLSAEKI